MNLIVHNLIKIFIIVLLSIPTLIFGSISLNIFVIIGLFLLVSRFKI